MCDGQNVSRIACHIYWQLRWEYELPLTGPSYEKAAQHLVDIGICEESHRIGANVLGTEIREFIIQPFRWNISSAQINIQPFSSLSSSPNASQTQTGTNEGRSNKDLTQLQYAKVKPARSKRVRCDKGNHAMPTEHDNQHRGIATSATVSENGSSTTSSSCKLFTTLRFED